MVVRPLLGLQFCVWVSAALAIPEIPIPGLSVCALPSCLHPSPSPPRPPFQGVRAGGSWAVEIGMCSEVCSGFGWRWPMGLHDGSSGVRQRYSFLHLLQSTAMGVMGW